MRLLGEFQRDGDVVERRFTPAEVRMIGNLVRGVVEVLDGADDPRLADDPVLRRLLPAAFPDDPDANAEFASAVRDRLADAKAAAARRMIADLDAAPDGLVRLDVETAGVWLRALGDLRLALAERIGIDELHRDVRTPHGLMYAWLTWLQGGLIEAVDPEAAGPEDDSAEDAGPQDDSAEDAGPE